MKVSVYLKDKNICFYNDITCKLMKGMYYMLKSSKRFLRLGGIGLFAVALLGGLPSPYPTLLGIVGVVLFFAAGPT